jgi:hypothetical protein
VVGGGGAPGTTGIVVANTEGRIASGVTAVVAEAGAPASGAAVSGKGKARVGGGGMAHQPSLPPYRIVEIEIMTKYCISYIIFFRNIIILVLFK